MTNINLLFADAVKNPVCRAKYLSLKERTVNAWTWKAIYFASSYAGASKVDGFCIYEREPTGEVFNVRLADCLECVRHGIDPVDAIHDAYKLAAIRKLEVDFGVDFEAFRFGYWEITEEPHRLLVTLEPIDAEVIEDRVEVDLGEWTPWKFKDGS